MKDEEFEAILAQWQNVPAVSLDRLPHNHIFQDENGIEGCMACDSIDPYHLTEKYSQKLIYGRWA